MKKGAIPGAVVPEGIYTLKLESIKYMEQSENIESPMVFFNFVIQVGEFKHWKVNDVLICREDTLWKLNLILTGLGVDDDIEVGEPLEWDDTFKALLASLEGTMVTATVGIFVAKNTGRKRNNIIMYDPKVVDKPAPEVGPAGSGTPGIGKPKPKVKGPTPTEDIPDWAKNELNK